MKKSNRELALEYLAKAQKEDAEKIKAFTDACFTDGVLNELASFTKTDFKKAGASLGRQLKESIFVPMKQAEAEKAEQSKTEKTKKTTAKSTSAKMQSAQTAPVQSAPVQDMPAQSAPIDVSQYTQNIPVQTIQ